MPYDMIKEGSTGDEVKVWQQVLGPPIVVDGYFGPKTKTATIAWQMAHGLQADGIVDFDTWDKVYNTPGERTQENPPLASSSGGNWFTMAMSGVVSSALGLGAYVATKAIKKAANIRW